MSVKRAMGFACGLAIAAGLVASAFAQGAPEVPATKVGPPGSRVAPTPGVVIERPAAGVGPTTPATPRRGAGAPPGQITDQAVGLSAPTTLTVRKVVVPALHADGFDLLIDGTAYAKGVKDGGSTAAIVVHPGTHVVSQASSRLDTYTHVFSGDCDASGKVYVAPGRAATCTITSTRKPVKPGARAYQSGPSVFTVCAFSGCDLNGYPGEQVRITTEAWGAGGRGHSGGNQPDSKYIQSAIKGWWPRGGGGGGSGAYARTEVVVTVPAPGSKIVYWLLPGVADDSNSIQSTSGTTAKNGGSGSIIRVQGPTGNVVLFAGGGQWGGMFGGNGGSGLGGPGITVVSGNRGGDGDYSRDKCPEADSLPEAVVRSQRWRSMGRGGAPVGGGNGYGKGGDGGSGATGCSADAKGEPGEPGSPGLVRFTW